MVSIVRTVILTGLMFITHSMLYAGTVDSLVTLIEQTSEVEEKVLRYKELLAYLKGAGDERVVAYTDELLSYAEKEASNAGLGYAYRSKCLRELATGQLDTALSFGIKSKEYFLADSNFEEAAQSAMDLGKVYERMGQFDQQTATVEEGIALAEKAGTDNVLGLAYRSKGRIFLVQGEIEQACDMYDLAIEKFKATDERKNVAITLFSKGSALQLAQPTEAISILLEARRIASEVGETALLPYVNSVLVAVYTATGEFGQALETSFLVKKQAEDSGHKGLLINALGGQGDLYRLLNDPESAQACFQEIVDLGKKWKEPGTELKGLGSLGIHFIELDRHAAAIPYLRQAIALGENTGSTYYHINLLNRIAEAYLKTDQLEKGYDAVENALALNDGQDEALQHDAYQVLGLYYYLKRDYQEARNYLTLAYEFNKRQGIILRMFGCADLLYQVNKTLNNSTDALSWLEIRSELNDSILNEENLRKITALELTSEFEKEKEILALEQEQEAALLKAETRQSQVISLGIAGLALLGFVFFWNARRQNQVISQQNQTILEKNRQLEQANTTKDRIFAIVGHDLRKPAIAFNGLSQTINYLLQKKDFDTLNQLGAQIEQNGFALQKLTDNLLSWALTQRDVMPYHPSPVQVAAIVDEMEVIFAPVAAEKKIAIRNDISGDVEVYADKNALKTIIMNLLDNALKFTGEGGTVQLSTMHTDKGVELIVEDNGQGMPAEKLHSIFLLEKEKSERGTAGEKGTGLGLHLVHELVKLNHGEIKVESRLRQGTTFSLLLPQTA